MPKLTVNESIGDFTDVVTFTWSQIDAALGVGNQITIGSLPIGAGVELCGVFTSTQLVSSADDYTIDVGTTASDPDEYLDATALTSATTIAAYNSGDAFVQAAGTTVIAGGSKPVDVNTTSAAQPIIVEFNGTGDLTAGEVVIAYRIVNPGRFA
jgi:hypothetical protein